MLGIGPASGYDLVLSLTSHILIGVYDHFFHPTLKSSVSGSMPDSPLNSRGSAKCITSG